MIAAGQCALVPAERFEHRRARVRVKRCAMGAREVGERAVFDEELVASVSDVRGAG
jgi:hypothetical protein